ncbi:FAD binding domain-containing protein [Spiractinospora alimapuensis]|uniref:FAD binding domain-containing protein n=1 Tax=Spiractinospora alimapuensis TaxID=2820884 RepID=UPI001F3E9A99|nr:FAD binding domain-containing protein [Spiractinospora alimapuensis]QVQ52867.1 FAD binding domain-containing protein [Spiractinospora alimapuensis]
MDFLRPHSWSEALTMRRERPDAVPVLGGTDVMVEINFDRIRPGALLDLTRVPELAEWDTDGDRVRVGAGVTYTTLVERLGDAVPALSQAARTVASPQIRNRGSVGGNLGAGSPAGDSHPPLLALDADIELESPRGTRVVPARDFYLGPKRVDVAADELIRSVTLPLRSGPQNFAKIGTRNAMVIAVCAFALALRPEDHTVGVGIGSAGPTPLRAPEAQAFLAAEFDWRGARSLSPGTLEEFGRLVADASSPIDDVRGTAAYRRHCLAVLARRSAVWATTTYREELACA